tara:strand:- start:32875 stop:33609 length:735 start_codon:yes stop_codon:yes gene_type:complete
VISTRLPGCLLLLLVCVPVWSEPQTDPSAIVGTALQSLDQADIDNNWFFTMEVEQDGENLLIRSDPRLEKYEKRQLLTVNGSVPGKDRLDEFRAAEKKRIDDIDPGKEGYRYLVDTATLQLIEESEGYQTLSFVPRLKDLEDSGDKVRGSLLLDTSTNQIEKLDIYNTENLSPAFSVSLTTLRLTFSFRQEQGAMLLATMYSQLEGKAGFVKSFASEVTIDFNEYQPAADCSSPTSLAGSSPLC